MTGSRLIIAPDPECGSGKERNIPEKSILVVMGEFTITTVPMVLGIHAHVQKSQNFNLDINICGLLGVNFTLKRVKKSASEVEA